MFRQSCIRLAKQGTSRTVVRDPRKNKAAIYAVVKKQEEEIASSLQNQTQMKNQPAFAPSEQNQQSVGNLANWLSNQTMNSFEQWVKSSPNLGLTRYGDQLIAIGATWDTFRRDSNEVISDLCKEGGIPKLVAHDIFTAVSEALQGMSRPLAIFWDIENVPIPTDCSGKEIISKIKSILLAHGQIVCFRAYASIGLNQIPEEKRSELQLSGCHLVDCPHNGRKEVADKMIIVDAMEFAYNNLNGASLCFITSDVDYAYLLSKLNKPQWKTIVISRQSRSDSLLYANCDLKFHWDIHVIGIRKTLPVIPPGFVNSVSKTDTVVVEQTGGTVNNHNSADMENGSWSSKVFIGLKSDQKREKILDEPSSNKGNFDLLCSLIEKYVDVGHTGGGTLKCHVASKLRTEYSHIFPDKSSIQSYLKDAINRGIVVEVKELGSSVLYKKEKFDNREVAHMTCSTSVTAPINMLEVPQKILDKTKKLPYILFIRKQMVPKGHSMPKTVMVQSHEGWLLLMFRSIDSLRSALGSEEWLSCGTLVKWNQGRNIQENVEDLVTVNSLGHPETFKCAICNESTPMTEYCLFPDKEYCCRLCYASSTDWDQNNQKLAASQVKELLQTWAWYDEMFIPRSMCRKMLVDKHDDIRGSRTIASLYIEAATKYEEIMEVNWKPAGGKSRGKVICLQKFEHWTRQPLLDEDFDTSKEEDFVHNILQKQQRTNDFYPSLDKKAVIEKLTSNFPIRMDTPFKRNKVFQNARNNGRFFVAKGPYNQAVAFTIENAMAKLHRKPMEDDSVHVSDKGCEQNIYFTASNEVKAHLERNIESSQAPNSNAGCEDDTSMNEAKDLERQVESQEQSDTSSFDEETYACKLRSKTIRELRLMCTQKDIDVRVFIEKDELVQALVSYNFDKACTSGQ